MATPDSTTEELTTAALELVRENPLVAFILIAVVLVFLAKVAYSSRATAKDPGRMFSPSQRAEGFARAGGRCELERSPFRRCKGKAHHGDHHFPWSKGGATSMGNFTAACVKCNTSKGAKIATRMSTLRMESRRRKYFPRGVSVKAGEKYAQR